MEGYAIFQTVGGLRLLNLFRFGQRIGFNAIVKLILLLKKDE